MSWKYRIFVKARCHARVLHNMILYVGGGNALKLVFSRDGIRL